MQYLNNKYALILCECVEKSGTQLYYGLQHSPKYIGLPIKLIHDVAYGPALLMLNANIQESALHYGVKFYFLRAPIF